MPERDLRLLGPESTTVAISLNFFYQLIITGKVRNLISTTNIGVAIISNVAVEKHIGKVCPFVIHARGVMC